MISLTAF